MDEKKSIIPAMRHYDIEKPGQMVMMANMLKAHVVKNKLSVPIQGKEYVMVEGWQYAGGLMGLFPRIVKAEEMGPNRWFSQAEIIDKTGKVVSNGFAICSKSEGKKANFDEYAILSMSQTRAIGKAFRNLIGWVMKMAGYESTPAEEMKNEPKTTSTPGIGKRPTTEQMISTIRKTKDRATLESWKNQIPSSNLYTENQKRVFLQAIEEQAKVC